MKIIYSLEVKQYQVTVAHILLDLISLPNLINTVFASKGRLVILQRYVIFIQTYICRHSNANR